MFKRPQRFLWLALLVLLTAGAVFAAETTGSISGVVRSSDGSPLPGVMVQVSGPLLPAGQSEVTGPDGKFQFLRLPPGSYQVHAELSGMGDIRREAIVALDRDTQVDLTLDPTMSEEITVKAAVPIIDVKSSEAQVNFTSEVIEDLPLARDYKGLFELAPGVSQNAPNRTAPNAGGSRLDNTFLVDGINITNPHYGDLLPNITEIDIDEVSIKRAGISAEFGRTGGMVVNAVTKSGTNQFNGEARFEYQPAEWTAEDKNASVQNTIDRDGPAVSLGGPLMRDHLWFYGSGSFPSSTSTDRRNNLGAIPDLEVETDEYFLKLTANPTSSHYFNAGLRSRETTTRNAGILASVHPSVGSDDSTDYLLGTAGWTWNVNADSLVEVKYNHNKEENSTDPATSLGYRPAFNAARPDLAGAFTTTADRIVGGATAAGQTVGGASLAINNQDFERDEIRGTFQTFKSWFGQSHDLRAGMTYNEDTERLERRANGWGAITWSASTQRFTARYISEQAPHTGRGKAYGIFLQDQFSVGDRTTITAGLLVNKDEYYGEALGSTPGTKRKAKLLTFDWDQQIQPRLGVSFMPNLDLGDKIYAAYGRYYNTENKSLERAASPTRIFTTTATFDAAGNLVSEAPQASTQTKTIDPGLDPQYTDEILVGYARPLGPTWSTEVFGMYREVGDIMEDISADGLGNGPFRVAQLDDAYREYTAFTLMVNRLPFDDRFMRLAISASYTWSRLEGNWDIDYANSLFYNSSILQDGPGVLITDNRDGILRGDRTHVAKIFATISPIERMRVGSYVRYQSGGAWEARGLPSSNVSSSFHRYLEPAGSRRMEDWLNVDLLTSYEFPLGPIGLELEGRILNVFDEQVALEVDDRLGLPAFGQGTQFSAARAFVVSAIVRY
ncbi:MAG TPA: carboxypeptidase regulatory-like domain-containing protein [Thermoanaerobaculia bacterium]